MNLHLLKVRLLCSAAAAMIFMAALPAFAQEATAEDNEFRAFREKLESARAANNTDAGATSALVVPLEKSAASAPLGPSPAAVNDELNKLLGPAGSLPLNPNAPAVPNNGRTLQTPEDVQAAMAAEQAEQARRIEELTFDAALKQLLPMTPEQIRKTYEAFVINRRAAEEPMVEPEAKQVVETVSLDPSDPVTSIRVSPGYVTTVLIVDASGAPWPVENISWAGKFDVTPPETGGNIMRITPQTAHGAGNISIKLVDLSAPLTMHLRTDVTQVYYRMDLRIPKQGPLAKTPLIEYGGLKSVAGRDESLTAILDGVAPATAEKVLLEGVDGRTAAWRIDDALYLRTPLTLLSPGWRASATSADGMNVYALDRAPVVLLSDKGRMIQARIAHEGAAP